MDFSGKSLQLTNIANHVANLVDNKVERVKIRCTSNDGFIDGMSAKLKIGNKFVSTLPLKVTSGYGVSEFLIPYGTNYTIEVQSYLGVQPDQKSFTADRSYREVDFFYDCDMAPLGVWIQTTDNLLIAAEDWSASGAGKTARGVAVITADHAFLIAKSNALPVTDDYLSWGGYGTDVPGCANTPLWQNAIEDFDSHNNTSAIIAALNPNWDGSVPTNKKTSAYSDESTVTTTSGTVTVGAPAAEGVRAYASEDMPAGKWDIPAFGVVYLMYLNKTAINAALTACGGTALTNGGMWSSTEYSASFAWLLYFANGNQSNTYKYRGSSVRAVAAFQLR